MCNCITESGEKCSNSGAKGEGLNPNYCFIHQGCIDEMEDISSQRILLESGIKTIDDKHVTELSRDEIYDFLNDPKYYKKKIELFDIDKSNKMNCNIKIDTLKKNKELVKDVTEVKEISDYCYEKKLLNGSIIDHPFNINSDEKCILLNEKKTEYYTFEYDPTEFIKLIETSGDKHLIEYINKVFDLKIRRECCNCFTFVIYSIIVEDRDEDFAYTKTLFNLIKYLSSILMSVENISNMLPTYLCKIYIDESTIKLLHKIIEEKDNNIIKEYGKYEYNPEKFRIQLKTTVKTLYKSLFEFKNIELYTILCDNISLSNTRSYRFLPLVDKDTNIVVSREADGIVTYNDCDNIQKFSNSTKILYTTYEVNESDYKNKICRNSKTLEEFINVPEQNINKGYSHWLKHYIKEINKDFFTKSGSTSISKNFLCTLLAGAVAFKIKINSEYFLERKIELKKYINSIENERLKDICNVGFDEILLLDIFKEFTTYDVVNSPDDSKMYRGNINEISFKLNLISISSMFPIYKFTLSNLESELFKHFNLNLFNDDENDDNISFLISTIEKFKSTLLKLTNKYEESEKADMFDDLKIPNIKEVMGMTCMYHDDDMQEFFVIILVEYIFIEFSKIDRYSKYNEEMYNICISEVDSFNNNYFHNIQSIFMINTTIDYRYKDIFNFYKLSPVN